MRHTPSQLKWSDDYLVGHAKIDADHKDIFELLMWLWSDEPPTRTEAFEKIVRYLTEHCTMEEEMMRFRLLSGEEIEAHKASHRRLQGFMLDFIKPMLDFDNPTAGNMGQLTEFVTDQLIPHIQTFDVRLASAPPKP
jgi:hemerythrin-like metal-binding protein